ncbi:MAG: PSD1 domain-containing protein, partial [Planctomycetales bacterium]|nr:PSD1 domain-containing protein [Planctomycetales bacterium]
MANTLRISILLALLGSVVPQAIATDAPSDAQMRFFESNVRPLLVEHCNQCHGRNKQEGELRLDSLDAMLTGGDSGPAIVPGEVDESLLIEAVRYESYEMPPSGQLDEKSINVLVEWIAMGAPWPKPNPNQLPELSGGSEFSEEDRSFWAFQPVRNWAVPAVDDHRWSTNPIDQFVYDRLQEEGLEPAPEADRVTLMRRAYFDLIGLPPTPEEVEAFVEDKSADAYAKLIDRLLESPHYGEKWGRYWLDLVRYAETHGYERDSTKPFAWRYRDYVIDSLNQDKPYDQFLREQLAGDEFAQPTAETLIATGYYRLGIWDDEPADRPQAKYDVLDDIVSTTGQVMLGMSIGCARCHEHKKDPIPQEDYYRLLGVFHGITDMNRENLVQIDAEGLSESAVAARNARFSREEALRRDLGKIEADFEKAWAAEQAAAGAASPANPVVYVADSRETPQAWAFLLSEPTADWIEPGYDDAAWPRSGGGFGNPATPGSTVGTGWNTTDIWLRTTFLAKAIPRALTLTIHHDENVEVYLNGERIFAATGYLREYRKVELPAKALQALVTGRNVLAVHCSQTGGGQFIDVGLAESGDALSPAQQFARHARRLLGEDRLAQHNRLQRELAALKKQQAEEASLKVMAVQERGAPPTHVLVRGNAHVPGEQVEPGVPLALGGESIQGEAAATPNQTSGKRLAFAQWLTSKENPLAARVIANRLWQFHFGRGIVPTANDFGRLGEAPTHPELLDWLASELTAGGWKLKAMHRTIMLSSAYRMASGDRAYELEADPANNLFWRFNMRRLTAEEIRDSILAVNGSLNLNMGGPSVYPEMPAAILATSSRPHAAWSHSPAEEQARRSIYVFVKRSLVYPVLADFDLADTDSSCAVRFTTTVPTQSLMMLNSEFASREAAVLAERLRRETPDDVAGQVRRALSLA